MMRQRCLLLVLLLSLLTGCGAGSPGDSPTVPAGATAASGEGEEGEMSTAILEEQARALTEEEILTAYDRAMDAYGWFYLETLPESGEPHTVDGQQYYRVAYPGMENLADLQAYLRGLFSEELVDSLLEGDPAPLYRDIDGELYVLPMERESDALKGASSIQIKPVSQTAYSVDVTVDLLDTPGGNVVGVECYTFPYVFEQDRWVFDEFRMIY